MTDSLAQRRLCAIAVVSQLCLCASAMSDQREAFFESRIRPLLLEKCVSCHGADKQEGGLRIDSRHQVLTGTGDVDALVNRKAPTESRLLQVLLYADDDTQMPPKGKLTDAQIADMKHWIESGAVWPENNDFGKASAVDAEAWKRHWAFLPITDPEMPSIYTDSWHPVDAFVRQELADRGIKTSAAADGRTLVRRLSYAIIGLPPKIEDLTLAAEFTETPKLFRWLDNYTDRLMAQPEFGQRWGRYWLDVARYSDTKGYVFREDRDYKEAWRYRNWVIRSLNSDMPYDEFLKQQIAADRLPGSDDPEKLAAMGFLTLGRRFLNNKHDIIDDRIDVLTRGTMALTVTCARCHDHKFDPIPTADYYSLYGVFDSSHEPKDEPSTLRLVDHAKPREPYIFVRGSAGNRGDTVSRHFLTALSNGDPKPFTDGSGRLELANKIASAENPLTARVAVNRIWLRLFGTGLVDSPADFGVRTPRPSHPELLDHLATYFLQNNWSRKALIRYITVSYTWRQSSQGRPDVDVQDPENRLLARMSRRRLNFEAYRDSLLNVAGQLDSSVGGESVDIDTEPFSNRRTIYARIDRQNLPGTFRTFDFASPDTMAANRFETTVPQQALFQLNNQFVMQQAQHVVDRSKGTDHTAKIRDCYVAVLQREPTLEEVNRARLFLELSTKGSPEGRSTTGWKYGWGEINKDKTEVLQFKEFPAFHDGRWGGGPKLPDPKLGWCMLSRDGGHTGHGPAFCTIRRWVADQDCTVEVASRLEHYSENGDGVLGHVIVGSDSQAAERAHNDGKRLDTGSIVLEAGQSIDFVADCGANESHDSFTWRIRLRTTVDGKLIRNWQSNEDFSNTPPESRLPPLAQLSQTLMLTNEFMFVD